MHGRRQRHPGQRDGLRRHRHAAGRAHHPGELPVPARRGRGAVRLAVRGRRAVAGAVSPDRPVALIENDGVLVLGTGVLDAFDRLEVLESTAEAVINSRAVGEVHRMDDERIEELVRAFVRK